MDKLLLLLSGIMFIVVITMKTSNRGLNAIKQHEKLMLNVYEDIAGHLTVGYGHKLIFPEDNNILNKKRITENEANELLKKDILIAEKAIDDNVYVKLTSNMYDALVSFIFNIGINAFKKSTLLKLLNKGLYNEAANQFTRWIFADGKESKGLKARREYEKALFVK